MVIFFTAVALVIAAVAVVVLRTLNEKRARVERFRRPSPTGPHRP